MQTRVPSPGQQLCHAQNSHRPQHHAQPPAPLQRRRPLAALPSPTASAPAARSQAAGAQRAAAAVRSSELAGPGRAAHATPARHANTTQLNKPEELRGAVEYGADAACLGRQAEATTARPKKPEVLAPAGGWAQLRAAVENGADAAYFGLSAFSARARAANFTPEELPEVRARCWCPACPAARLHATILGTPIAASA